MADRTTGELREAPIGSLPGIGALYDDTLLPVEQQGEARKMTGEQWKRYAQASVEGYVESAKDAAAAAADSAEDAARSAKDAAQSASEAAGSARTAREYSGKPPVIRGGFWWVWDAEAKDYKSTGEAARGNVMYATFFLDAASGNLYMYYDEEYAGPRFRLSGADLEVVLTYG